MESGPRDGEPPPSPALPRKLRGGGRCDAPCRSGSKSTSPRGFWGRCEPKRVRGRPVGRQFDLRRRASNPDPPTLALSHSRTLALSHLSSSVNSRTNALPHSRTSVLRRRIRRWMRPPRRLRFSRAGWFFSGGSVMLGVAAIGTGNNLLFLMLGGMLGFITLSGWLSEQMLRRLQVRRRPARATAGTPSRIVYEVRNGNRRLPAYSVE